LHRRAVALADDLDVGSGAVELRQLVGGQGERGGGDVLLEAVELGGAGDRDVRRFWARIQASATWAGVAACSSA
jgi:hypothetical protein